MTAFPQTSIPPEAPVFGHILCAAGEYHHQSEAVRQASALTGAGAQVDFAGVSPVQALALCRGHDLLVLPAGDAAIAALALSPIPVLIARPAPEGARFPDSILIAVDDSPEAREAARLGGRLAARHGACVALVASPEHDAAHRRTLDGHIAAVVAATGRRPLVLDEHGPAAPAIVAAAGRSGSSLLVIGSRPGEHESRVSTNVARDAGCSVLVLRAREPIPRPAWSRR